MLWLYDIPTVSLVLLFGVVFVGFTWLGSIFVRPLLRLFVRSQPGINDIVGYVLSSHCVFYGLLLGLLAVATYQNLTEVERIVVKEAGYLRSIYRNLQQYPEPLRSDTLPLVKEYVRYVIEENWPAQRRGITLPGGIPRMNAVQSRLFAFEPQTKGQEIMHQETMRQFTEMAEVRRARIQSSESGIPGIMWYLVGVGALITVALVWLFDMRLVPQFVLGGALALFVGTVVCIIVAMDRPFRGDLSLGPGAYIAVYERMTD
jgi:hypothetical protein